MRLLINDFSEGRGEGPVYKVNKFPFEPCVVEVGMGDCLIKDSLVGGLSSQS